MLTCYRLHKKTMSENTTMNAEQIRYIKQVVSERDLFKQQLSELTEEKLLVERNADYHADYNDRLHLEIDGLREEIDELQIEISQLKYA